jgi:hypothetical protein
MVQIRWLYHRHFWRPLVNHNPHLGIIQQRVEFYADTRGCHFHPAHTFLPATFNRLEIQARHVVLFSVRVNAVHLGCPHGVNEMNPAGGHGHRIRVPIPRSAENAVERFSIDPDEVSIARRL